MTISNLRKIKDDFASMNENKVIFFFKKRSNENVIEVKSTITEGKILMEELENKIEKLSDQKIRLFFQHFKDPNKWFQKEQI